METIKPETIKPKIFIIMPFKSAFDSVYYRIIKKVLSVSGLEAIRGDEIVEPGDITEQILNEIRESLFVIADISIENDNVFYELGYAHALNKKTILISKNERDLPFDVSVFRTIMYDDSNERGLSNMTNDLQNAIEHIYKKNDILKINKFQDGMELKGHVHTISGYLYRLEMFHHFWFFARREDLDIWWPQDDGEVRVHPNCTWKAQLFLGLEDREEDMNRYYDIKFGFINTIDNRTMTEFCIDCLKRNFFPGIRQLPASFREIAEYKVKRIKN